MGFWPANSVDGDDITVWCDDDRQEARAVFRTLRQQMAKPDGRPNVALADFVAPADTGVADFIGAFAVTTGIGLDEIVAEFEAANDDYSAILAKALADRLAEAFAERLHQRVRRELWGYAPDEALTNTDLIAERYQGIRPAPGYPACPDHTEKETLFDLLEAESRAGIRLDRIVRDVAGRGGLRLLPVEPGQPLFRGRSDRSRPARRLRGPKGRPARRGRALARAEPRRRGTGSMSEPELVDAFAAFPGRLAAAAKARVAEWRPFPEGEWGPNETVRHLIAVENEVWRARLARLAKEDDPHWTWTEPGPRTRASTTRRSWSS